MSKFAPEQVYLAYILADDHLFLAGYAIHGSQDPEADWDYLRKTLSSIYGYPSESAKRPLPPTIEEIGFDGSWCEHFTLWDVDGTAIYAGVYQGSAAIFYYGYEYYTNLMDQPHNSEDEINTYGL